MKIEMIKTFLIIVTMSIIIGTGFAYFIKTRKVHTVNINGQMIVLSKIDTITAVEKSQKGYSFKIIFSAVTTEIQDISEENLKKTREALTGYLYRYYK